MEIYLNERPSALPAGLAPLSTVRTLLTVATPWVSQAHQAQVQAELIQAELVQAAASAGTNGTSGFTGGEGIQLSKKRMDVRGVPPRGRPV
jgi:hypothetical protein